jgi:hypothetical protein
MDNDQSKGNRAQRLAAYCGIVSACCATITAIAACVGVYSFVRSVQRDKLAGAEEAIARLYPFVNNVANTLGHVPNARKSLYSDPDGIVYAALNESEKAAFKEACSALGDVLEYYLLVREKIQFHPKGTQITDAWDNYLKFICQNSCGFRGYMQSTRIIWAAMLLEKCDEYSAGLKFPASDN